MNYIDRLQRFCLGRYELLMMKKGLSIENDGTMMVQKWYTFRALKELSPPQYPVEAMSGDPLGISNGGFGWSCEMVKLLVCR